MKYNIVHDGEVIGSMEGEFEIVQTGDYPPITFQADRTSLTQGQSVKLTWSVENVDGVWLNGKGVAGSGPTAYLIDTPAITTTYILKVLHHDETYAERNIVVTVTSAPPPITMMPAVGANLLFASSGLAVASDCKAFLCMNNTDEAAKLANCDPTKWFPALGNFVLYRQYLGDSVYSPDAMIAKLGDIMGKGNHNVVLTLCNEWDCKVGNGKDGAGMAQFCDWTTSCIDKLNSLGWHNIAVMTSSMGTPDFTRQDVCDAIKTKLAPYWNRGKIRFIDMHNYSPTMDHIYKDNELIWYERRWEFLFTKCGFNPVAGGKVVAGETGVDEGGVGGFPAHHATGQQVVDWAKKYIEVQSRPLVVGGISYPSPFLAGTIFQQGDTYTAQGHWGGYAIDTYMQILHDQVWHMG